MLVHDERAEKRSGAKELETDRADDTPVAFGDDKGVEMGLDISR